ncbi:unnamed protein product [Lactuca saligna]|uniref:Uncharacterized protein n=1 Tax=Lactuca saligna TaxID=75948 RepID=A0AA36A258_LACSI|nr:unnamed protein product [Lactuca saligna]
MVSIIVEHLGLRLLNNPIDIIPGHTHLSVDAMGNIHIFHRKPNGDVHWTIDGQQYLHIDSRNKKILTIANYIPSTNWTLRSNLGIVIPRRPPNTTCHPSIASSGASSLALPIPFPKHNIYMGDFA